MYANNYLVIKYLFRIIVSLDLRIKLKKINRIIIFKKLKI